MWSFEFRHETSAQPAAIWKLWSNPAAWPRWDDDLEEVTLEGPFEVGTKGALTPKGMDAIPFELTRVALESGYTDESELPGAVLRFDHDLLAHGERFVIVQRVTMTGPSANDYFADLGRDIVLDVPDALRKLAALAETA